MLAKIRGKGNCGGAVTQKTSTVQCPNNYTSAPVREADGLYINTCPSGHQYISSLNLVGSRCYTTISQTTIYTCDVCGTSYSATGTCTKKIKRNYLESQKKGETE